MVALNVIGPKGPTLQVRAKKDGSKDLDKTANDAIEAHWKRWCKTADITGRMTLAQLLRVGIKGTGRDGEALIRTVRNKDLPYGMGLQLLEADRLDETINARLSSGVMIRMGVEIDTTSRPLAYHLKVGHPGENYRNAGDVNNVERVPASQIYHVYLPERAEQVRGYTWFHAVLLRAARIQGYEEAALVAALVGASKVGVFTRSEDAGTGTSAGDMVGDTKVDGIPQISAEPGEMLDMTSMPGVKLESWNPDYPHQNFESFLKQCMRGFASGLDVATHNLSGDMTDVNYSSARIAELSERDMWMMLQEWFFSSTLEKIFKDWLASALIRGDITFPESGKALPAVKLSRFADAARFQGRTWPWIDPQKEIGAKVDALKAKLTSRTRILAESGDEFEDVVDELAQEQTYADTAGVSLVLEDKPAAAAPGQPAEGEDPPASASGKLGKQITALGKRLDDIAARPPALVMNIPEGAVQVRTGDTHIHVPEQPAPEVKVDVAAPIITVAPAQVVIEQPSKTVETIERDAASEIRRIEKDFTYGGGDK